MTPAMNPGMKGQPQAGLAALAQPAQAPKGMSSGSMQEILDRARMMSDAQLADILSGKSMDVPQYVAMTEAMGRKSLRTAMQGAQAQQQAKQPSVKDRLLAENAQEQMAAVPQAGLDQLPAPNMDSVDMASGGIVAFQDNEDQPVRLGMPEEKNEALERIYKRAEVLNAPNMFTPNIGPYDAYQKLIGQPFANFFSMSPREQRVAFDKASEARKGERGTFTSEPAAVARDKEKTVAARKEDVIDVADKTRKDRMKQVGLNAVDLEEARAGTGTGLPALLNAQQRQAAPKDVDQRSNDRRAALAGPSTVPGPGTGITPEKRTNPFAQLSAELPDYEKVKNQGLGEAMMAMSGALFGNRNISTAMAQGLPTLAKLSGATRKEVRELKKDYNAQQLNLAKANELFAQGQEDLGFKYLKQSQDHAYHMQNVAANMLQAGKPSSDVQLLQALQKPGETPSDTYARMKQMGQDPRTDQALMNKHADYMKSAVGMVRPLSYNDWLKENGYGAGGQQVAGAGNQGYSVVYGPDGKRI